MKSTQIALRFKATQLTCAEQKRITFRSFWIQVAQPIDRIGMFAFSCRA
jgi:hypothetical protein